MQDFLFYIGWYNALGAVLLTAMHRERVADFMLHKATEVVAEPYRHEGLSRLWLWWAIACQAFLGAIMLLALRWPIHIQREVAIVALGAYAIIYVAMCVGARKPTFGRGIYVVHVLWIAQMSWAGWSVWS